MKAAADYPDGDEAAILRGTENPIPAFKKGWPAYMRIPQHVGYYYLGLKTARDFQILGATLAIAGALGINWLLLANFGLSPVSALLAASIFNLTLLMNTELHKWAAFAIPLYPMRIFCGFLFLWILSHYSDPPARIGWPGTLMLAAVLAVFTFMHPILVLGESAVVASLWITWIARRQFTSSTFRRSLPQSLCLVAVPALVGALIVLIAPHSEMRTPRDNIQVWYFYLNDAFPKDIRGLAQFVFTDVKLLLSNIGGASRPWVNTHPNLSAGPLFICALGTAVSLSRPRELRFAVAVYVLIDLTLRLCVNLAGAFPFAGLERYALSVVFGLAVLTVLGLVDIVNAIGWLLRRWVPHGESVARAIAISATLATISLSFWIGWRLDADITHSTMALRRDIGEIRTLCTNTHNQLIIVEDTTYAVLHYYVGATLEKNNSLISIPKMYIPRDISPGQLAGLEREFAKRSSIQTVTRLAFDERNFREAYRAADARFDESSRRELLQFYFATWTLPGADRPAANH